MGCMVTALLFKLLPVGVPGVPGKLPEAEREGLDVLGVPGAMERLLDEELDEEP